MLQRIIAALIIGTISAPANAAFVPEPTTPPVITNSSGTRVADGYIPIPKPPISGPVQTETRQQCLNRVSQLRIARQRAGWSRERSAKLWVKQVNQCPAAEQSA